MLGLGIDQLTKLAIVQELEPGASKPVYGDLLRFTLVRNSGAAFGFGQNATLVFSILAILAFFGCLVVAIPRVRCIWQSVTLGLLMAGISGNLYDRLFQDPGFCYGHVIDFIQLPYFAIFNVADICITAAACLLILASFIWLEKPSAESLSAEKKS